MLCSATIYVTIKNHVSVMGEFSHTSVATVSDIVEACAFDNEAYKFSIELVFQRGRIDTCGG